MGLVSEVKNNILKMTTAVGQDMATEMVIKMYLEKILRQVMQRSNNLGGMGQYGEGWNDRGTQLQMIVSDMIKELNNDTTD